MKLLPIQKIEHSEIDHSVETYHLVTVEKAKDFIKEKFDCNISLQEIASYSCVSPYYFSRLFRKFTGYSPYQYLLHQRLKHGKLLLKNSYLPVSEIAFLCGFSSVEHFSTSFRNKYKSKPTIYRKMENSNK